MSKEIISRPSEDGGLGVGGGPRTMAGFYHISGALVVEGPANTIGRRVTIELTAEQFEWLVDTARNRLLKDSAH